MTDPDDHTNTRPISVAELLARNGSIGAPPVGGRRRRRRGNADSVTVAELTGEIPIITETADPPTNGTAPHLRAPAAPPEVHEEPEAPAAREEAEPEPEPVEQHADEAIEVAEPEPRVEPVAEEPTAEPEVLDDPAPETAEVAEGTETAESAEAADVAETADATETADAAEADYAAYLKQRAAEDAPIDFTPPVRRPQAPPSSPSSPPSSSFAGPAGSAEAMSPDPLGDDDDDLAGVDLETLDFETDTDDEVTRASFEVPSYLRSSSDTLFGGQSVADDIARRGAAPVPEDIDLGEDTRVDGDELDEPEGGNAILRGLWVVVQCILAVAFGAGLFIAFDLLWKWNTIVALVLAVLVILGLVAGVRVVRKTEDIGSTLIAVAVGALVAFGPLALLQSH